jgi:hypothetical protein
MIINKDILSIICEHLSNEHIIKLYDVFKRDIPIHIVENMLRGPPLIYKIMNKYNRSLKNDQKYYRCSYEDAMYHYYMWIGLSNGLFDDDYLYDNFTGSEVILKYIKKCEKNVIESLGGDYFEMIEMSIEQSKYFEEREDGIYINNRKIILSKLENVVKFNEKKILDTIREYIILNEDITYSNILKKKYRTKMIDIITEKIISEEMDIYQDITYSKICKKNIKIISDKNRYLCKKV